MACQKMGAVTVKRETGETAMRKPLQDIWYEIGITINNDPDMLEEVRRIKKDADRLPQSAKKYSTRRWVVQANSLLNRAWLRASSFYEDGELGKSPPGIKFRVVNGKCIHKLFDVTYCEDPGKAVR